MKVSVFGLLAAAQRLVSAAEKMRALEPPALQPLAPDPTSLGAAGRLEIASTAVWSSTCAQITTLETVASHLVMIAARFGTQEEVNRANLAALSVGLSGMDEGALSTLAPVPPLAPDVRPPLPPPNPSGEAFSQLVTVGSSGSAADFSASATTAAAAVQSAALTLRSVSASIPECWDSPVGTPALTGRIDEHAAALDAISEQWSDLGGQASRHGQQYEETVAVVPKPQEFKDNETALRNAQTDNAGGQNSLLISQLIRERGELEQRALATALRYHGETETTTGNSGVAGPQPTGASSPGGAHAGAASVPRGAAVPQNPPTKAGAAHAGQAGAGGDQLAQMLPSALGAIGGLAGVMAGMAGQVPQALMQSGQGLAQAATQGMSGLASRKAADADKSVRGLEPDELFKEEGAGGAGGGGGADTHPAGALGPPVTPSASHTPPTMPAGAAPPPTTSGPAGGATMGGMPMGMPMGGLMPHSQGGDGGAGRVPADKKVVTPPQPHTEPVTGKVSDRTAAAAEASRTRADSGSPADSDDPPPRGPVLRRITLAPLNDERT